MMDTIRYARELELDMLKFGITIAFPGTPMFQEYRKKGLIRTYDWDHYEVYTDQDLFTHERLAFETIQQYMKIAYREAIFKNPRFIFRRIKRGVKTGEFFWDAFYSMKYFFLPAAHTGGSGVAYAHRDEWPVFDFASTRELTPIEYQQPSSQDWRNLSYTKRNVELAVPV